MSDVSKLIDDYIDARPAWQAAHLRQFREAIRQTGQAEEVWKWDVPVFAKDGKNVCSMAAFKEHTKWNFMNGAALPDPDGLFNNGFDSKKSRSIDLREGDTVMNQRLRKLVEAAFAAG